MISDTKGLLVQATAFDLPFPDKHFHAIITSPPYYGLRLYSGEQGEIPFGTEATPEEYIARLVTIFREVRRVLRDDGVAWLNLGDNYYNYRPGGSGLVRHNIAKSEREQPTESTPYRNNKFGNIPDGSLFLMPHRVAMALQSDGAADPAAMEAIAKVRHELLVDYETWDAVPDKVRAVIERLDDEYRQAHAGGWIVRQDLVWSKPNPMPMSVNGWRWEKKDGEISFKKASWRHTRSHEFFFMLTKEMKYWGNLEAMKEYADDADMEGPEFWDNDNQPLDEEDEEKTSRNPRSVVEVATSSYKGKHFAVYPSKLIAPLIRASVPRRCCPVCEQGWSPLIEREPGHAKITPKTIEAHHARGGTGVPTGLVGKAGSSRVDATVRVLGYRPTCEHYESAPLVDGLIPDEWLNRHPELAPIGGIVLDIFGGSGTTGKVAKELLRRWVVMDISRPYLDKQAKIRTGMGTPANALDGLPLFSQGE